MNLSDKYKKNFAKEPNLMPVELVYPDYDGFEGDYEPLLNSLGCSILVKYDQDNYQGDSWILYRDENRNLLGYLSFGWGSCPGCYALQICTSYDDLRKLQQRLYDDIIWFDSLDEAENYFDESKRSGDYAWSFDEYKDFVKDALNYIKSIKKSS